MIPPENYERPHRPRATARSHRRERRAPDTRVHVPEETYAEVNGPHPTSSSTSGTSSGARGTGAGRAGHPHVRERHGPGRRQPRAGRPLRALPPGVEPGERRARSPRRRTDRTRTARAGGPACCAGRRCCVRVVLARRRSDGAQATCQEPERGDHEEEDRRLHERTRVEDEHADVERADRGRCGGQIAPRPSGPACELPSVTRLPNTIHAVARDPRDAERDERAQPLVVEVDDRSLGSQRGLGDAGLASGQSASPVPVER